MMLYLLLLLFLPARADSTCERRFTYSFIDTPPSYFVTPEGEKKGHSYELLKALGTTLNCPVVESPGSFTAIKEKFMRHGSDILALSVRHPELDKHGEFVELYKVPRSLIVEKKLYTPGATIESYIKNPKITFASVINVGFFITAKEHDYLFQQKRLLEVPNLQDVFTALEKGRVQALFSTPVFTHHYISKTPRAPDFQILPDPSSQEILGIYISLKRVNKAEMTSIKRALEKMKKDGTLENIAKEYVRPEDLTFYKSR